MHPNALFRLSEFSLRLHHGRDRNEYFFFAGGKFKQIGHCNTFKLQILALQRWWLRSTVIFARKYCVIERYLSTPPQNAHNLNCVPPKIFAQILRITPPNDFVKYEMFLKYSSVLKSRNICFNLPFCKWRLPRFSGNNFTVFFCRKNILACYTRTRKFVICTLFVSSFSLFLSQLCFILFWRFFVHNLQKHVKYFEFCTS